MIWLPSIHISCDIRDLFLDLKPCIVTPDCALLRTVGNDEVNNITLMLFWKKSLLVYRYSLDKKSSAKEQQTQKCFCSVAHSKTVSMPLAKQSHNLLAPIPFIHADSHSHTLKYTSKLISSLWIDISKITELNSSPFMNATWGNNYILQPSTTKT